MQVILFLTLLMFFLSTNGTTIVRKLLSQKIDSAIWPKMIVDVVVVSSEVQCASLCENLIAGCDMYSTIGGKCYLANTNSSDGTLVGSVGSEPLLFFIAEGEFLIGISIHVFSARSIWKKSVIFDKVVENRIAFFTLSGNKKPEQYVFFPVSTKESKINWPSSHPSALLFVLKRIAPSCLA